MTIPGKIGHGDVPQGWGSLAPCILGSNGAEGGSDSALKAKFAISYSVFSNFPIFKICHFHLYHFAMRNCDTVAEGFCSKLDF